MGRLIAIIVLLSSCHAPIFGKINYIEPIIWSFDCSFPEKLQDEVRHGFDYWDHLVGFDIFEEATCDSFLADVRVSYINDFSKNKRWWAAANSVMIRFYMTWGMTKDPYIRTSVSRHEVGHVLGLDHNDEEECLMHPHIDIGYGEFKEACDTELRELAKIFERKKNE